MLDIPMFLFLLTAREGRVSVKALRPLVTAQSLDATHPRTLCPAPLHLCVSCSRPAGIPKDKTGNIAGVLYRH
jgi:hypothetical protein